MKIHELNDLIAAVCPIEGINSDGVIWFKPEATDQQKAQAQAVWDANVASLDLSNNPEVRDQIEQVSNAALRSGALYELIALSMRQFLEWAQSQNPAITEADLLDPNGPYYSVGYAHNKMYYDQLVALMGQK